MHLTPEQEALGRRTFLKALAGTPALVALGTTAPSAEPLRGGPVRVGFIGVGAQGRVLLDRSDPAVADVRAVCDINPAQLVRADEVLAKRVRPPARHYAEWREMLEKEDLEAVITAVPLWMHADVVEGCLDAGKHVLCEKMMGWDVKGCKRMSRAAEKNRRVLEIAYQRCYNPIYQAAYDGVIQRGLLGDIYYARLAWHRNANWRRQGDPPSPDYDPSRWGYPTFEHLWNWRLYWRYSQGLMAELASHQINVVDWFLNGHPTAAMASGGLYRFNDGREVYDHVYVTWEYPGGRTATFSSIESNAFEEHYEAFYGTKGTLVLKNERDALLFEEGQPSTTTGLEISPKGSGAVLDASETRPSAAARASASVAPQGQDRPSATGLEIARFCSAIRMGTPLACGPERAFQSARACLSANEAIAKKSRIAIST